MARAGFTVPSLEQATRFMNFLDHTCPSPAENLACDETLLDRCEAGSSEAVLRFWESPKYFVVVGYANKVASEVNVAACEARDIPIFRRCSGGGAVVQGPGCLNYVLVLPITADGPTRNISAANRFIMERNRATMETLLHRSVEICGHTDLATGGLKFSGNSQRRRHKFLLFHGTFLLNFELHLISELLGMPSRQPDYRQNRIHSEFVTNVNLPAANVKTAMRKTWGATSQVSASLQSEIARLVEQKYSDSKWNWKF